MNRPASSKIAFISLTLMICALLVAAVFLLGQQQPAPQALIIPTHTPTPLPTERPPTPTASLVPTVPTWIVQVTGAVARPGVVSVPPGSRVIDAVEAAGGLLSNADLVRNNLAAFLSDGQQIHIYPIEPGVTSVPDAASGGEGGASSGPPPTSAPVFPIRINQATAAELEALPGIGPTIAQAIIDFREARGGRINDPAELLDVPGIGEARLRQIRDLLSFE